MEHKKSRERLMKYIEKNQANHGRPLHVEYQGRLNSDDLYKVKLTSGMTQTYRVYRTNVANVVSIDRGI